MLKIAEMEYNGANSIFLRLLLDKKYALPFRVLDALVAHFLSFRTDKRTLPVLWHQSLLTLVQRYKVDLSSEQKEALGATEVSDARKDFVRDPARAAKRRVAWPGGRYTHRDHRLTLTPLCCNIFCNALFVFLD